LLIETYKKINILEPPLLQRMEMCFSRRLKEMKILLIDDDKWIRDSLSLFFEGEGYLLVACETGEEGLETLRDQTYDIIIVDYKLPGMDGLEFLRRIEELHPGSMKVLVTAYKEDKVIAEANRIGVDDFIEKPFTAKTIEESLSRLIEKQEQKNSGPL
jgi:CheY-like chemotaxis protein